MLREWLTDGLIWGIRKLNRYKNRCLAARLQELVWWYDPKGDPALWGAAESDRAPM